MDMGMGMMGVGLLMMLIVFALAVGAVALIVWAIVHFTKTASGTAASAARRILDERYARGEIDDDEYTRRKRQLS